MNAILGSLEKEVMRLLWQRGETTVRDAHAELSRSRRIAYTTVMTVMQRLAEKGILLRKQDGAAYRYRPAADGDAFFRGLVRELVVSLRRDFGTAAVASFLDEAGRARKR